MTTAEERESIAICGAVRVAVPWLEKRIEYRCNFSSPPDFSRCDRKSVQRELAWSGHECTRRDLSGLCIAAHAAFRVE
jgi:hypothetical protein